MAHPMGESKPGCLRVVFDRRLKLEFQGALEIPCHFCKLKKRNDTCEKNLILM